MHSGAELRLCLHEEIGLHFFRGLERSDFAECRRHYTQGRQQTPYVKEHGLCRNVTDQQLMTSACSGLPLEKGGPMRDGCQTYLATLGRPLGSEKAWELTGVAVCRQLDWRLESEALKRSLLEFSLIFYKQWTELKLDRHIQIRVVHCLLYQVSLQLHFVHQYELQQLTKSKPTAAPPPADALLELAGVVVDFFEALTLFKEAKLAGPPVLGQPQCTVLRKPTAAAAAVVQPAGSKAKQGQASPPASPAKRQKLSEAPQLDGRRVRKAPVRFDDQTF